MHMFRFNSPSHGPVYENSRSVFNATFLQLPSSESNGIERAQTLPSNGGRGVSYEQVESGHASSMFDTWRDQEMTLKKAICTNNKFGMFPDLRNQSQVSLDWVVLMNHTEVHIYKCSGLRNVPVTQFRTEAVKKIKLEAAIAELWRPNFLVTSSC